MPGPIDEFKERLLDTIERQYENLGARQGVEFPQQGVDPINIAGAGPGVDDAGAGSPTGYSAGETVVPFVWGVSVWGAGDVWSES